MTSLYNFLRFILIVGLSLAFFERPAHAYVDPGTGSMLMQLLLGGVAGLAIIFKLYWNRIKAALGFRKADERAQSPVRDVASPRADQRPPK